MFIEIIEKKTRRQIQGDRDTYRDTREIGRQGDRETGRQGDRDIRRGRGCKW